MNFRKFLCLAVGAALCWISYSTSANAQIGVSINIATPPPPLPIYAQPEIPGPGYIWTPGYWAWDPDFQDYYWVPGTWVLAPQVGFLWTPPWWGWNNGFYGFHDGYWGPHVGFYGGIAYGYGYTGNGYYGGRWNGGHFFYNRSVNNIGGAHITNVYSKTVNVNRTSVSYNGGKGGIAAKPTASQLAAAKESHVAATSSQVDHARTASSNTSLRYSSNHGKPAIAATAKPGVFNKGVVPAGGATRSTHTASNLGAETHNSATTGQSHTATHTGEASAFTGENHTAKSELPQKKTTEAPVTHTHVQKSVAPTQTHTAQVHHAAQMQPQPHVNRAPMQTHAAAPVRGPVGGGGGHPPGGGGGGGHGPGPGPGR